MVKALLITRTNVNKNPGSFRMASWLLEAGYDLDIVCGAPELSAPPLDQAGLIPLPRLPYQGGMIRRVLTVLDCLMKGRKSCLVTPKILQPLEDQLIANNYDLVICNDIYLNQFARSIALRSGAKHVVDAREYYPRQYEESFFWRLIIRPIRVSLCRDTLAPADLVMTVSPGLADEYAKEFSMPRPLVVESFPDRHPMALEPRDGTPIRLLYQGAATPQRGLHHMITMMDHVEAMKPGCFTLTFVTVPVSRYSDYIQTLQYMAKTRPYITFADTVGMDQICDFSSHYDISLITYPDSGFNLKHCLPNKFFEAVQARMAVLVADAPDMEQYLDQYGFGVAAGPGGPNVWAKTLASLNREDIERFRRNADKAANDLHEGVTGERVKSSLANLWGQGGA